MNTLKAEKRNMTIKAKKLRHEGFVTGNLFGREVEKSIPLQMDKRAVDQLLKEEGKGGQVMLEVNGQTYDATVVTITEVHVSAADVAEEAEEEAAE
jgi:large subunit ribosomal protein L25